MAYTGTPGVNYEYRNPFFGIRLFAGPCHTEYIVSDMSIGNKEFGAVDDIAITVGSRFYRNRGSVIAGAGFGQGESEDCFTAGYLWQVFLFLFVAAGIQDGQTTEDYCREERTGQAGFTFP